MSGERSERACGGCTACCQVVPVRELGTRAYQGCPHVHDLLHAAGPGCGIYPKRPGSCRLWRCGWIENTDWPEDLRPDRAGFIVDEVLDLIKINGAAMPAVQIWALPGHAEDWRQQPALGMIAALLHHKKNTAVLWRQPGGLARGFALEPDGRISTSEATRDAPDDLLGGSSARIRRAARLYAGGPHG